METNGNLFFSTKLFNLSSHSDGFSGKWVPNQHKSSFRYQLKGNLPLAATIPGKSGKQLSVSTKFRYSTDISKCLVKKSNHYTPED